MAAITTSSGSLRARARFAKAPIAFRLRTVTERQLSGPDPTIRIERVASRSFVDRKLGEVLRPVDDASAGRMRLDTNQMRDSLFTHVYTCAIGRSLRSPELAMHG